MDSLSQFLLGAAAAEVTVGKKIGRTALIIGGVLGTLPDLDVLVKYTDAVESFTYHRSWSHSVFTLTLVSIPLAWILFKAYPKRFSQGKSTPNFWQWLSCTWLVLITHPLLDGFTIYGTQLLWPLPSTPVAWGSIFIIDPLYTLPLLVGVIVAWKQRHRAFKAASLALAVSTFYIGTTLFSQQHARAVAIRALNQQSLNSQQVLIAPSPFSMLWRIVAMDGENYYEGFYSLLDQDQTIKFDTYPSHRGLIESNSSRWPITRLDWFTQGFISASSDNDRLLIHDLRMGMESSYVFRFDVGPLQDTNPPTMSTQLPLSLNVARMKALVKRVWDEDALIPTDN